MANKGFTGSQKQYLEGLASGLRVARGTTRSILADVRSRIAPAAASGLPVDQAPLHPDHAMLDAQNRFLLAGQRLSPQEQAKRLQPPNELWARMVELARERRFPEGDEAFLYKFHGLFYASAAEESFMCRLRFAGGRVFAHQLRGVADLAERWARPVLQLTARSNLQLRGIPADATIEVLSGLFELGIVNRGAGGDAVRNVGASPTSGFDRRELIDTLPLARQGQQRILTDRSLQALPRKFTLAFDGGGSVSALAETCDLGFRAVRVPAGEGVEPGIHFRLMLGGATSHGRYARDAGVLVAPSQCMNVLEQVLHIYVEHGDRTNRRRARLAYLLESWGMPQFVAELQARLRQLTPGESLASSALPLIERALDRCELPEPPEPLGHIGFHNQKPRGTSYVGVVLDSALLTVAQARGLAQIAEKHGSGELRLTPHQNLLIPGLSDKRLHEVKGALDALGVGYSASAFRSQLVACTGSPGCHLAKGDTKRRGEELASHLRTHSRLDRPLRIIVSGCHHACAPHTTADIGLMATRDPAATADAEHYQVWFGGELSGTAHFGRKYASSVPASEVSRMVQEVVDAYVARRLPDESFREFIGRTPPREPERGSSYPPGRDAGGVP